MKKIILAAALLAAPLVSAQDAPAAPDVNAVIEQMAAVGPEALLARVKELRAAEADLAGQATALRQQADQKDAEAAAVRARIAAVEKFTGELAAMIAPPPAPPAAEAQPAAAPAPAEAAPAPAEAAPAAPAPAEAAPAPAPAEAAPAEAAPAPPAEAAPAPAEAAPAAAEPAPAAS
jgi:pyruvate dehydrogenase E2 component (dihydrolipoamide acetyltransferase)